ncbi:MAG: FecR domain-containing protein [Verrucomicrobiae bacterium]|nr:FecR domain-containing protein [Verrucomicrobiae bacterium]
MLRRLNLWVARVVVWGVCLGGGLELWGQAFHLSIGDNGRLLIYSPRGEKVEELPQATIGRVVEVPPVVFEVSYGKDISNLLMVIISPSADRPTGLNFMVGGKRIQMDAQAVVTLTFNQDRTKLRVDPGYIGQVSVDGNVIVEETEYVLPVGGGIAEEKGEQISEEGKREQALESMGVERMPPAPSASTTRVIARPQEEEEELPSTGGEMGVDVSPSFLKDSSQDMEEMPLGKVESVQLAKPDAKVEKGVQNKEMTGVGHDAVGSKGKNERTAVVGRAEWGVEKKIAERTKPLLQGYRPNQPLSASRIDLGNINLEGKLFTTRKDEGPRLVSYYRGRDKKAVFVYPENYIQTPTGEYVIADGEQYPDRVYVVETFFWMEPVTPPNRLQTPRVSADKMALVEMVGDVRINTQSVKPSRQMDFSSGALLETGAASSVAVFIGGVNSIRLGENSSMRLQHRLVSGYREVIGEVDRGLIFVKVGQRTGEEQRVILRTPRGVAEAKGTDFALWVDQEGVFVFLKSGEINLLNGKDPLRVLSKPREGGDLSLGALQKITADRLQAKVLLVLEQLKRLNQKTNEILEKASRGLALQRSEREYLQMLPTVDLAIPVQRVGGVRRDERGIQGEVERVRRDRDESLREVKEKMRF